MLKYGWGLQKKKKKKKVAKEADRKANKEEERNDVHCKKKVASKKFLKENMIHCLT